jgi:dienelactone hydrolase
VLITPFDSIKNVAQSMYPIYPLGLILKDKYASIEYLKSTTSQNILILMAKNDTLIPNKHSHTLANSLNKNAVKIEIIENVGHNSISNLKYYYDVLHGFMREKK